MANNMMRTFSKSLRVGLMVDIGGGIPSVTHDIRLGDIVVSYPTATCGGVVQHDMGKVGEGGKLTHTGSLNSPPILLAAVNQIRAAAFREDPLYLSYIQQAIQKNVRTRQNFSQPDQQHDRFFQTQHRHPSNAATCDGCLAEWEVERDKQDDNEPQLYYGIIASGNIVVKDNETREQLQKETGGQANVQIHWEFCSGPDRAEPCVFWRVSVRAIRAIMPFEEVIRAAAQKEQYLYHRSLVSAKRGFLRNSLS